MSRETLRTPSNTFSHLMMDPNAPVAASSSADAPSGAVSEEELAAAIEAAVAKCKEASEADKERALAAMEADLNARQVGISPHLPSPPPDLATSPLSPPLRSHPAAFAHTHSSLALAPPPSRLYLLPTFPLLSLSLSLRGVDGCNGCNGLWHIAGGALLWQASTYRRRRHHTLGD